MLRKVWWWVAALALVLIAPAANAGGFTISANGGFGIPLGDFSSSDSTGLDAKSGPAAGIDICYHASDIFAVGVDAGWNSNKHSNEGETVDYGGGITEEAKKDKYVNWHFGVHGKYMPPMEGKVHPYGLLGIGIFNVKEDYEYIYTDPTGTTTFTDESDNVEQPGSRVGGRIGAGATYMTSEQVGVGLEADYNYISLDKDKFEVSSLTYFTIRLVVSYMVPTGQ